MRRDLDACPRVQSRNDPDLQCLQRRDRPEHRRRHARRLGPEPRGVQRRSAGVRGFRPVRGPRRPARDRRRTTCLEPVLAGHHARWSSCGWSRGSGPRRRRSSHRSRQMKGYLPAEGQPGRARRVPAGRRRGRLRRALERAESLRAVDGVPVRRRRQRGPAGRRAGVGNAWPSARTTSSCVRAGTARGGSPPIRIPRLPAESAGAPSSNAGPRIDSRSGSASPVWSGAALRACAST